MLWQSIPEQWASPLVAIMILAVPFVGAFVRRRGLGLDSKLASAFQDIPINVVLAVIIVVLGLSAIIITPILPLFALGVIAFFSSHQQQANDKICDDRRALYCLWCIDYS